VGAHVSKPAVGYWSPWCWPCPRPSLIRLFIIQHDCGHAAFLPVDPDGRHRRLDPPASSRSRHTTIGEDPRAPSRHLGQSRAPRVFGDIDTLTVARVLARSRWERSSIACIAIRWCCSGWARAALLRATSDSDHRAARVDARAAQHLLDGRGTGNADRANGDLRGFASSRGAASRHALSTSLGVWLFLRPAPVRAHVLGARRALGYDAAALQGARTTASPNCSSGPPETSAPPHSPLHPRIPNYRLQQALDDHASCARVPTLTLGKLRCVRLTLWDERAAEAGAVRGRQDLRCPRSRPDPSA